MLFEKSCGGIVFRRSHGNVELLLIRHTRFGLWSFPKGHMENGETEEETAVREIKEETGIDVIIDPSFREAVSYSPKKNTTKEVVYFLARATTTQITVQKEELYDVKWVEIGIAGTFLSYKNDKLLAEKARRLIS